MLMLKKEWKNDSFPLLTFDKIYLSLIPRTALDYIIQKTSINMRLKNTLGLILFLVLLILMIVTAFSSFFSFKKECSGKFVNLISYY